MTLDISQLRADFLSGENSFLTDITEKYSSYCVNYMRKAHQCTEDEARDLFTECILSFREAVIKKKLTEVNRLKSYLLGTCINLHKFRMRQDYRKVEKADEIKMQLYGENDNFLDITIKEEADSELVKVTMTSFKQLGEKCQHLLGLYYVHQLSLQEIASEMGFANHKVAKSTKYRCYQQWMKIAQKIKV